MSKGVNIIVIRILNICFKIQNKNEGTMERTDKKINALCNCQPSRSLIKCLNKVVGEPFSVIEILRFWSMDGMRIWIFFFSVSD